MKNSCILFLAIVAALLATTAVQGRRNKQEEYATHSYGGWCGESENCLVIDWILFRVKYWFVLFFLSPYIGRLLLLRFPSFLAYLLRTPSACPPSIHPFIVHVSVAVVWMGPSFFRSLPWLLLCFLPSIPDCLPTGWLAGLDGVWIGQCKLWCVLPSSMRRAEKVLETTYHGLIKENETIVELMPQLRVDEAKICGFHLWNTHRAATPFQVSWLPSGFIWFFFNWMKLREAGDEWVNKSKRWLDGK